jgi:hypothetical protein
MSPLSLCSPRSPVCLRIQFTDSFEVLRRSLVHLYSKPSRARHIMKRDRKLTHVRTSGRSELDDRWDRWASEVWEILRWTPYSEREKGSFYLIKQTESSYIIYTQKRLYIYMRPSENIETRLWVSMREYWKEGMNGSDDERKWCMVVIEGGAHIRKTLCLQKKHKQSLVLFPYFFFPFHNSNLFFVHIGPYVISTFSFMNYTFCTFLT